MRTPLLLALGLSALSGPVCAQDVLPEVTVTEKAMTEHHGGVVISGDFKVDTRTCSVIHPTEAPRAGDVLSVQPLRLADDEYLVLQECVSIDCAHAQLIRVRGAFGATTRLHEPDRIIVPHEGKYFVWMSHTRPGAAPPSVGTWFTEFDKFGAADPDARGRPRRLFGTADGRREGGRAGRRQGVGSRGIEFRRDLRDRNGRAVQAHACGGLGRLGCRRSSVPQGRHPLGARG